VKDTDRKSKKVGETTIKAIHLGYLMFGLMAGGWNGIV